MLVEPWPACLPIELLIGSRIFQEKTNQNIRILFTETAVLGNRTQATRGDPVFVEP